MVKKKEIKEVIFERVIVSCDVGVRKPRPKIYKLTLRKLKLKPSQTIFIDDLQWNTKPPQKFWMKTILFKNISNASENWRGMLE